MIFRNTFRLLFSNFSNVWKVLVYYCICIILTFCVCGALAYPIIVKLSDAKVFESFAEAVNGIFASSPELTATRFQNVTDTAWSILSGSRHLFANYIIVSIWMLVVFPFTLDLAQLPMGEVLYGYMTSQTKYGFTGRFIKTIGKSAEYSVIRLLVTLPFNIASIAIVYFMIKLATFGNPLFLVLDILLLSLLFVVLTLKYSLLSCWMPAISVLDLNVFEALSLNFRCIKRRFASIFSTGLLLVLIAFVFNLIFGVFSFTVSFVVSLPLTAFVFVIFQMVSFFSAQGMRFYVYPDLFISPKTFEESLSVDNTKYII